MSNNIAITVQNLSKAYQLGQIGTGTISRDLERWYARMRGKEDPFLRIGESNNQNTRSTSDVVWSLKDINFEIEQGDAVGIIGRNGAGKSTLLKILSKVTAPTTGKISGKGRIASLLEVGTGFHPELSGRENIFLNGAILGMRKREIQRKLDEIVDFAGIERYLDTPVKRYSSGMYVRLAFAVAAHLESEILIVDEVLAVGDAEFQKKCLGKMGEVSKGEGRTVLFVSHNMDAVKQLCNSGIYLLYGQVKLQSDITTLINTYSLAGSATTLSNRYLNKLTNPPEGTFNKIVVHPNDQENNFDLNLAIKIEIELESYIENLVLGLQIIDKNGVTIIHSSTEFAKNANAVMSTQKKVVHCIIPPYILNVGRYKLNFTLAIRNKMFTDQIIDHIYIEVSDNSFSINLTTADHWQGKSSPKIILWE